MFRTLLSTLVAVCAVMALAACNESVEPGMAGGDTESVADAADDPAVATPTTWVTPQRVLFLHRSVGGNLIRNGAVDMYDVLAQLNAEYGTDLELWHHFCGTPPWWNRYYDGDDQEVLPRFGPGLYEQPFITPGQLKKIFCDPQPQYVAVRDSIDNFRVVLFKSGYDNTITYADDDAEEWRGYYRTMKESEIFTDPSRRIIVLGFPPTREGLGTYTQVEADSSRAFNDWLVHHYVTDRTNLFAFPLFDRLAGEDNWLRDEYELVDYPNDAHPNAYGCEIVGGELMAFIYAVATQTGPVAVPAAAGCEGAGESVQRPCGPTAPAAQRRP
jgi:hypothetical protein